MTEQNGSNSAKQLTEEVEEQAADMQSNAEELSEEAQEQAKQLGKQVQATAEELADQGQQAYDTAAHQTAEGIDQAAMAMGGGLRSTASTLRERAPESGVAADMARKFASTLEQSGSYLEDHSRQGIIPESQERKLLGVILLTLTAAVALFIVLRGIRRR